MGNVQFLLETTNAAESAVLEEMLAVERFHRGEPMPALQDFQNARVKLSNAVRQLEETNTATRATVSSLGSLEQRFHSIAGGMFSTLDSLSMHENLKHHQKVSGLTLSHNKIMASLDELRVQMLSNVTDLEREAKEHANEKQEEMNFRIEEVMVSLLLLAAGAIVITSMIWFMIERKVSRPITRLMEEAKSIDTFEVR